MFKFKFGRLPRKRNPAVPHFSALTAGAKLPSPPASVDYTAGMPANLGLFGNDSLGDCTCAAIMHAIQVWTFNAQGKMEIDPDQDAVLLYEQACGYNPSAPAQDGQNPTDQGGDEQSVLTFVMLSGAPVGQDGISRHRIAAFVEIDPRNPDDVKLAIATGGLVYLGFEVPDYMPEAAGSTWDVQPGPNANIVGGHAVIAAGYDANGLDIISWGAKYRMTWAFWSEFVDEAYLLADQSWIESTGKSPAGLSLADLETQMQALNDPGASGNGGGSVPMRAPTGLQAPVPHDPRIQQLVRQRDAAHLAAAQEQGRAVRAESLVQEHAASIARVAAERDQHIATAAQLRQEQKALRERLGASEVAREKAERARQSAEEAAERVAKAVEVAQERLSASESAREKAKSVLQRLSPVPGTEFYTLVEEARRAFDG